MMMKMKGMCSVHKAAWILVLIGALNWGLVGLFNLNLVTWLLGGWPVVERVVYVVVGVAGLAMLGIGKCCAKGCKCEGEACAHCDTGEKKPEAAAQPKM